MGNVPLPCAGGRSGSGTAQFTNTPDGGHTGCGRTAALRQPGRRAAEA
jgi:hypothetical protein